MVSWINNRILKREKRTVTFLIYNHSVTAFLVILIFGEKFAAAKEGKSISKKVFDCETCISKQR